MKILVLDEEFPYPLNTGKRIRSFNLITRLADRHQIQYLAYGSDDAEASEAVRDSGITPVTVDRRPHRKSGSAFYMRLAANLFSALPYIVTSHYSRCFARAMEQVLEDFRPDLILCEWTPYAFFARNVPGIRKVIVAHNIESRIWQRYLENERNPLKRWYIGQQLTKVEKFERNAFRWVDGATAVSVEEAEAIASVNHRLPVEVIDNGVDPAYFSPAEPNQSSRQLVFTGAMDWRPNQDAAVYFVRRILPLLHERDAGISVTIVGRRPPPHVRELGKVEGVTVTGTVDDVRPFISSAAVYICPLRIGGGSRLKILEALAMQRPVVSTTVGAEGLEVSNGKDILIADTPREFAGQVETLLAEPSLGRQLATAGRQLVQRRYRWGIMAEKLEGFLTRIVGAP